MAAAVPLVAGIAAQVVATEVIGLTVVGAAVFSGAASIVTSCALPSNPKPPLEP